MDWWQWVVVVGALALVVVLAVNMPDIIRYWKISKM